MIQSRDGQLKNGGGHNFFFFLISATREGYTGPHTLEMEQIIAHCMCKICVPNIFHFFPNIFPNACIQHYSTTKV